MCDAMRSLESNQQPRFLASGTGWISESPTRMLILSSFFSCCDEPMMRNSVLSSLNLRSLFNIQERMSLMQSSIFLTTASYSAKWDVNLWIICATVNHLLKGIRFSHHCHFPPMLIHHHIHSLFLIFLLHFHQNMARSDQFRLALWLLQEVCIGWPFLVGKNWNR